MAALIPDERCLASIDKTYFELWETQQAIIRDQLPDPQQAEPYCSFCSLPTKKSCNPNHHESFNTSKQIKYFVQSWALCKFAILSSHDSFLTQQWPRSVMIFSFLWDSAPTLSSASFLPSCVGRTKKSSVPIQAKEPTRVWFLWNSNWPNGPWRILLQQSS